MLLNIFSFRGAGAPWLLAAGALLGAVLPSAAGAQTLARLANGEQISAQDLNAYVERRLDLRGAMRSYFGAEAALKEMVLTRTLVLEGERLDVARAPEPADEPSGPARAASAPGKEALAVPRFDDVYAQAVYARVAPKCERPADAVAARKYFDTHPAAFRIPPSARLTRIKLPVAQKVDGRDAMSWLHDQAAAIAAGTAKLADVVARADEAYRVEPQGDIGWAQLDSDNALIRALAGASQGDLVGPVQEGGAAYLFSVEVKRPGRQMTWKEAAESAPARAVSYCREQAIASVRASMFGRYGVQIDTQALRSLFARQHSEAK